MTERVTRSASAQHKKSRGGSTAKNQRPSLISWLKNNAQLNERKKRAVKDELNNDWVRGKKCFQGCNKGEGGKLKEKKTERAVHSEGEKISSDWTRCYKERIQKRASGDGHDVEKSLRQKILAIHRQLRSKVGPIIASQKGN